MSHTWELYCPETNESVWIGQGWSLEKLIIYTDDEVMENMREFLSKHKGKPLYFLNTEDVSDLQSTTREHAKQLLEAGI